MRRTPIIQTVSRVLLKAGKDEVPSDRVTQRLLRTLKNRDHEGGVPLRKRSRKTR